MSELPRALRSRLVVSALFNVFAWMGFATLALRSLTAGQGAMLVYTMPAGAARWRRRAGIAAALRGGYPRSCTASTRSTIAPASPR